MSTNERIKMLAARIDRLAQRDQIALRQARDYAAMRLRGAQELHAMCAGFVNELNRLLTGPPVEFAPENYGPAEFDDTRPSIFQINIRGRLAQIEFEATDEYTSTEDLRTPYTLEGAIRCFNQDLLQQHAIEEHLLFYCVEKDRTVWRFFDARNYRTGTLTTDYLIAILERIL